MSTKLLLVVMHGGCGRLVDQLLEADYRVTQFSSVGGFLRRKHTTLLIGVPGHEVEKALTLIRAACPTPPDADEHNATLFVLDAGQFIHL
jgi:uncharacterized protein YaaQ